MYVENVLFLDSAFDLNTILNEVAVLIADYSTGVCDLFHVGHLNLFKNAKGLCDKLVVGVTVDELVAYKGKDEWD